MRSGKLDRTIRIDRYSDGTVDSFGTPTVGWTALASMRAEIIQTSAREFMANGAETETAIIFRTRYLAGVTTADRVHYGSDDFNIREIKELGRGEGLEIRCVRNA